MRSSRHNDELQKLGKIVFLFLVTEKALFAICIMEQYGVLDTASIKGVGFGVGFFRSSSLHSALPKSFRDLVMEEEKCMNANNSPGTGIKRAGYKETEDSSAQNTIR